MHIKQAPEKDLHPGVPSWDIYYRRVNIGNHDLGRFELVLLYAVLHLQDDEADGASGPAIRRTLAAGTGRTVSPGAIYTALNRLEARGLVSSALGEPTPERGGKRKRHYRLRASGIAALRSAEAALARMARLTRSKA